MDFDEFIDSLSLHKVFSWTCSFAMMVGGIIPYIPQYQEIRRTENADGFSMYVCLTLLVANTLRIIFWFGHNYELPLLFQSIVMNISMLTMIHLCVKVKNRSLLIPIKQRFFSENRDEASLTHDEVLFHSSHPSPHTYLDFEAKYFWEWTDFLSYLEFLATFTAVSGVIMYFFIDVFFVVESVGFLAVFIEAMLGTPQFYKNLRKKSTLGMSKKMVLLWLLGDVCKTVYFIVKEAPTQFWVCGILQTVMDILILFQVFIYRVVPSPVKLLLKGEEHTR